MNDLPHDSDPAIELDTLSPGTPEAADTPDDETSAEFLSSWNRLVSTTNWEKGRIICAWRKALRAIGAAASSYSDEAWSRRVGGVSPQHVGRLRRVHERFHKVRKQYKGLFWSHFQAAIDWDDAEMWLEGAVQSGWSVSAMRERRWEAVGAPANEKPRDEDIVLGEWDEDVAVVHDAAGGAATADDAVEDNTDRSSDSSTRRSDSREPDDSPVELDAQGPPAAVAEPVRPFEGLAALPADLHEAVEAMKLAILNHKLAGWRDVRCDDVLAVLSALKQLALAPSEA